MKIIIIRRRRQLIRIKEIWTYSCRMWRKIQNLDNKLIFIRMMRLWRNLSKDKRNRPMRKVNQLKIRSLKRRIKNLNKRKKSISLMMIMKVLRQISLTSGRRILKLFKNN